MEDPPPLLKVSIGIFLFVCACVCVRVFVPFFCVYFSRLSEKVPVNVCVCVCMFVCVCACVCMCMCKCFFLYRCAYFCVVFLASVKISGPFS